MNHLKKLLETGRILAASLMALARVPLITHWNTKPCP
jgi:hypothetical protein